MLLEAQSDMAVVGEAEDGSEVAGLTRALGPDVVLLDLSMPGPRSGEVIRQVLRARSETRVLILTMHDDPASLAAAISAGAAGYVVKRVADFELLSALRAVAAGRMFVDVSQPVGRARDPDAGRGGKEWEPPQDLSRRERQVLRLLAQGHSNKQIADHIQVSVKTVETYRARLRRKLGLERRADLYRFAVESGLLEGDAVDPDDGP
jgi:two-component system response regulator NreC